MSFLRSVSMLRPITRTTLLCRPIACTTCHQKTQFSTQHHLNVPATLEKPGLLSRFKESLGFKGKLRYKRRVLHNTGMRLYLCCAELVDYNQFMHELDMPDTFNSWFRIMELHIWLVMVRLAAEGREGAAARNSLMEYLWKDVDKRSRKLGPGGSARREGIAELADQLKLALFSYDEGLLCDDHVLAGALWRTFFQRDVADPRHLEAMVRYVRKQTQHLSQQSAAAVLEKGVLTFPPLTEGREDDARSQQIIAQILSRT